jgi:hypothetical protein
VFEMQHTGATHEIDGEIMPCTAEINGGFFLRIVAKCTGCGTEHLLLDQDFHGWNGFVCGDKSQLRPRPHLVPWPCNSCGKHAHTADAVIFSEDKAVAIDESGGLLDETNWQEGFGWININIRCVACGRAHESWVSYETM